MARPPHIVVLTGAGISADSGLATFRDAGGIWSRHRIEDVATPDAFARDPARVHAFYNARRAQLADPGVRPNAAHLALAAFDAAWPHPFLLVTQNVDDLHARAGSRRLRHMHGELGRIRCTACDDARPWQADLSTATACPACGRTGTLRPDVVWFGEVPRHLPEIGAALEACDLFLAIGTSAQVYPAAGFVAAVRGRARRIELNLEPTEATPLFDEAHHGRAVDVVPPVLAALLARHGAA
jgi:NAD-dependent deacetylase